MTYLATVFVDHLEGAQILCYDLPGMLHLVPFSPMIQSKSCGIRIQSLAGILVITG